MRASSENVECFSWRELSGFEKECSLLRVQSSGSVAEDSAGSTGPMAAGQFAAQHRGECRSVDLGELSGHLRLVCGHVSDRLRFSHR